MPGLRLLPHVLLLAALGALNTGCGIIGWAVSPKTDEVSYAVPRTQEVEVRSIPDGALVLVDGAEAGRTPKTVRVSTTEVRRLRKQSVVPGVIGLVLDAALFGAATVAFAESNSAEGTLLSAGVGATVLFIGTHLVFGRNVSEDSTDVQPTNVEIGAHYPGYPEQRRRIRVPDIERLDFLLAPVPQPTPAPVAPPPAAPAPGAPPSADAPLTPPPAPTPAP
jgi:hypothetical protein